MDKLSILRPVVSDEANQQASHICALIEDAVQHRKNYVQFTCSTTTEMHPLVHFTLVSKGYKVRETTVPNGIMRTYIITT
jgi:hypothetical protein